MTNRNIFKTLLLFTSMLFAYSSQAQSHVEQVLVANGGAYGFNGNYITIGSYKPSTQKYTLFDSVTGGSVTQILTDSGYAYMATDSYLVKYNLSTLKRVAIITCHELRYLAVYKDKIVATIGYDLTTTHLKIFKKSDLSLVYAENKMPNIYADGITISGDSAYIALQGQDPLYNDTGRIAVEDLANQKFKRVITLDTTTRGITDMFSNATTLIGVTEYPYSAISEIDLKTGAKKIFIFPAYSISTPLAFYDDTVYTELENYIEGFNASNYNIGKYFTLTNGYAAATVDTLNKLFYFTGQSYTSPTKAWIYDFKGNAIDSFDIGIAPQGIAIDYEPGLASGINEKGFAATNLQLYPNPAQNQLNISGIGAIDAEIKIMDMTGRVLFSQNASLSVNGKISIPVSQLPQGIYFVNIQNNDGVISQKFVKK